MKSELIDGLIDVFSQVVRTVQSIEKLTQLCHRETVKMNQGLISCNEKDLKSSESGTATAYVGGRKLKYRTFMRYDGKVYVYPMGKNAHRKW